MASWEPVGVDDEVKVAAPPKGFVDRLTFPELSYPTAATTFPAASVTDCNWPLVP
jgi:hypothetical protein